jgi:small subunit ribosomal protein S1
MEAENARLGQEPKQEEPHDNNANMASLLEQEGVDIDFPKAGEVRKGVIASITPTQILVSIGGKSEGVIAGKEFEVIPPEELAELKIGQEIIVFVINPEDPSGNIILSYTRAREETDWIKADELKQSKQAFHSKIVGYNKGGIIVPLGGIRGFIPASQLALSRRAEMSGETPDQKYSKMVGEDIDVCVIEVDRERHRLILSERAASSETREMIRERVMETLKEGDIRTGHVTSVAEFGAFVNINGADGLVHVSEVSWDKIAHPGEVLKVGQEVKVKVITIDHEKKRIGLSIRQLLPDPWEKIAARYHVGQLVEGKITRLTKFGAFARLADDVEGLIHISEMSEKRIEHPKEVLHEGDVLPLRVIKIDPTNHRIGLSVRKVESMAYADQDFQALEEMMKGEKEEKTPAKERKKTEGSETPKVDEVKVEPGQSAEEEKPEPGADSEQSEKPELPATEEKPEE